MYELEDKQFFDELYQLWSKTSWAKNGYWMPREVEFDGDQDYETTFDVVAVNQETQEEKRVASVLRDEDADFITALHGALPDLIRRLHDAIDEAVRKDEANDMAQGQLADALLENAGLREQLLEWERRYE